MIIINQGIVPKCMSQTFLHFIKFLVIWTYDLQFDLTIILFPDFGGKNPQQFVSVSIS